MHKKWDIKYIQRLPAPREGATENIGGFITKKFTQRKTSCTWKFDILEIPDKKKILENCFENMNCFSWIKLIPALIHLKHWYPYLPRSIPRASLLPSPCLLNFTLANWNPSLKQS